MPKGHVDACFDGIPDWDALISNLNEEAGSLPRLPPERPIVYRWYPLHRYHPFRDAFRETLDEMESFIVDANFPFALFFPIVGVLLMAVFPLRVVAKSRMYDDHIQHWRWVRMCNGELTMKQASPHRPVLRWVMDRLPKFLWKRMPVKWQAFHLFCDDPEWSPK